MIADLAAAVLTAVRAGTSPVPVHDGEVPDLPAFPYVVVWSAAPLRSSDRITAVQGNGLSRFQTSCVGLSPAQARAVQQRVHDALLDTRLVVEGRHLTGVKHEASPAIYPDHDQDPTVFLAVDQWSVFSTLA